MRYILSYEKDEEYGSLGFKIEGTKNGGYNMATDGLLVAHDIVEHSSLKDIGSIGDELRALGAIWFVRGQFGELRRDSIGSAHTPQANVASDVANMGRMVILDGLQYREHVPVVKPSKCSHIDDLREIIEQARPMIKGELEGTQYKKSDVEKYLADALKFMIRGFNRAKARYTENGRGYYYANNLFWCIADAANDALKMAEFEGQRFALHVNKTKITACAEELYTDY